uniref:Uncharacterized protein n=1 Tax=Picea glauca TaxID=3330 RepID=A0A101M3F2_PICGL|nr:hypothetical protein ABT39_MTgene50 [Picea glauca]
MDPATAKPLPSIATEHTFLPRMDGRNYEALYMFIHYLRVRQNNIARGYNKWLNEPFTKSLERTKP